MSCLDPCMNCSHPPTAHAWPALAVPLPFRSIRHYAAKNVELVIRLATGYAWGTAMTIMALVATDVWATHIMSDSTRGLLVLWEVAYWWAGGKEGGAQLACWRAAWPAGEQSGPPPHPLPLPLPLSFCRQVHPGSHLVRDALLPGVCRGRGLHRQGQASPAAAGAGGCSEGGVCKGGSDAPSPGCRCLTSLKENALLEGTLAVLAAIGAGRRGRRLLRRSAARPLLALQTPSCLALPLNPLTLGRPDRGAGLHRHQLLSAAGYRHLRLKRLRCVLGGGMGALASTHGGTEGCCVSFPGANTFPACGVLMSAGLIVGLLLMGYGVVRAPANSSQGRLPAALLLLPCFPPGPPFPRPQVEIPRSLWLTSSPEIMLKWCAHR